MSMKRDPFSQYHPLVCFLYFVAVILFGTVLRHPAYILAGCVAAGVYYGLLRGRALWKLLFGLIPLFLLVTLINPLFNPRGAHVLFRIFDRPFTLEALCYGGVTAGSFVLTFLWFGCYNCVLTGDKFTSLFANRIPALSLLLVMVLRMIGEQSRKLKQILHARSGIGKGITQQSKTSEKLRHGVTALSTLADRALEGSVVTADSMRARGYGCAKRSSFYGTSLSLRDGIVLVLILSLAACVPLLGGLSADFDPEVRIAPLGWGFVAYCILLLIPIILRIKEALLWRRLRSKI